MTKLLSIHHTVTPEGHVTRYLHGMRQPVVRCMRGIMKNAIMNEVRKGGLAYQELSLINQARKLASK